MAEPLRRLRSELSGSGGKVARPHRLVDGGASPQGAAGSRRLRHNHGSPAPTRSVVNLLRAAGRTRRTTHSTAPRTRRPQHANRRSSDRQALRADPSADLSPRSQPRSAATQRPWAHTSRTWETGDVDVTPWT